MSNRARLAGLLAALLFTVSGCASKNPGEPMQVSPSAGGQTYAAETNDPLEYVNRGIFRFNEVIDGLFLSPMAHIYRGLVPEVVQPHVKSALTNLNAPVVFVNSVLQADVTNAGRTLGRFVINSTVGIAGLFDPASSFGIPKEHKKDFGQTLGVWGLGNGPYLMVPIIGPCNLRDGFGMIVDVADDPWTYIFTWSESWAYASTRIVVTRADYLPLTDRVYRDSLDPYATFRSIYTQHRAKVVRDYLNRDSSGMEKEKPQ